MAATSKCTDSNEPPTYHPHFRCPDADIILASSENTLYRVPSFTLRNTCGYFRNLFPPPTPSVPNNNGSLLVQSMSNLSIGSSSDADAVLPTPTLQMQPIDVHETDKVLTRVLSMLCGLHAENWESIQEVEDALVLIQKWDAPGPLSIIRCAITAPVFLAEPLRLYAISTRFGWEEEAKLASSKTLALDLFEEAHSPYLERLSSKHLMALLRLHRRRRDELKRLLDGAEGMFEAGNSPRLLCPGCGEELNNHSWRELKSKMFYEIDKRPLGDTLIGLEMEEWQEAVACWGARCRKTHCGRLIYDKLSSLRDIKKCIDKLPTEIA